MDIHAFETFLESQETALKAVLSAGTQIEPKEIRKSIDQHVARTQRIVRNILPPLPNPAHTPPIPLKKSTPKSNPLRSTSLSTSGKFKTPTLKNGQRFGGATTLFGSRRSDASSGGKHARVESGSSSAGSPPESPIVSCKKMRMRARRREDAPEPSPTLTASLAAGAAPSADKEKKVTQVSDIMEGYGIRDPEDWDEFGDDDEV